MGSLKGFNKMGGFGAPQGNVDLYQNKKKSKMSYFDELST